MCSRREATIPAMWGEISARVCMDGCIVCMFVSVTLKNVCMSRLGMQFYTMMVG